MEHIQRWMQEILGTTDQAEAAQIIRATHSGETIKERHENRLYHAEIGRKGHGIGLSADEALIDAAQDAYFKPFIRDLNDLNLWRDHQRVDLKDDLKAGRATQSGYEMAMGVIDAKYQERRTQLLEQYSAQAALLKSNDQK